MTLYELPLANKLAPQVNHPEDSLWRLLKRNDNNKKGTRLLYGGLQTRNTKAAATCKRPPVPETHLNSERQPSTQARSLRGRG